MTAAADLARDDWPPPGSTVRRRTARVLPVDARGRVLLLQARDPAKPDHPFWFTIGGAIEPGESSEHAAVRELREETGIVVTARQLGSPCFQDVTEFSWLGYRIVQAQMFFAVAACGDVVTLDGLDHLEQRTIEAYRWWIPDELEADGGGVAPGLTAVMRRALHHLRRP